MTWVSSHSAFIPVAAAIAMLELDSATRSLAVLAEGREELDDVDGLRDVAVEPRRKEALPVAVHRLSSEGEHGDRRRAIVRPQPGQHLGPVEIRKLDVHQHQIRGLLGCELDGARAGRGFEREVARGVEDVPEELHVLLVVLDDEDSSSTHGDEAEAGSVNTNVLPSPSSLSTQIRPPCSSTKRFERARPSPVPSRCASPASVCVNSSKIRSRSSGPRPGPVSATETRTSPLVRAALTSMPPPAGVNFTAFESRLKITCLIRRSSPSTMSTSDDVVTPMRTPFVVARSRTITTPRSRASGKENGATSSSTWPASTFDRSRTSLINESRWLPEERMSSRYSSCFSFRSPNIRSRSTCENPMIAFNGVRSSCDMLARNSDLWRLVASSSRYRRRSSSFI